MSEKPSDPKRLSDVMLNYIKVLSEKLKIRSDKIVQNLF
jgi:hypothetical protein